MSEAKNNSSFIIGVAIGAALTYLFTTKNGQKIKEELLKEGTRLLEKLGEGFDEVEEKMPVLKQTQSAIEEVKENIVETAQNVQEKGEEALREVPKQVAQIQKRGRHFFFRRQRSES